MERDVHQTAQSGNPDFGYALDRFGLEPAVAVKPNPALAFGDQHVAAGQKSHAPGVIQSAREDDDPYVLTFRGLVFDGPIRQRGHNDTGWSDGDSADRIISPKLHLLLRCRGLWRG